MAHVKNNGQLIINTTQRTQKFLELEPRPFKIYLQFGKGKANKDRPRVVINWVKGLKKTRNKPLQQEILQNAGLRVPQFFGDDVVRVREYLRNGGTVVGKRINHSRGRGIKKFTSGDEFATFLNRNTREYYYQSFHDMNREWRIHVSAYHDEPVVAYRKCLRGEIVDRWRNDDAYEKPWVRNLENCYFKLNSDADREPWFDDMVQECKDAIDVLDMDIAGVDIGENNNNGGDYVIYEVNSACGMETHTRECYEEALEDIVTEKARGKGLI